MLAPDNVQVPEPVFCKVPVPLMTPVEMTSPDPPNIAAVVSVIPPVVIAPVPLLFISEPLMLNDSDVTIPLRSTVAPAAMVVAVAFPSAVACPSLSTPADTVEVPVNVLG